MKSIVVGLEYSGMSMELVAKGTEVAASFSSPAETFGRLLIEQRWLCVCVCVHVHACVCSLSEHGDIILVYLIIGPHIMAHSL